MSSNGQTREKISEFVDLHLRSHVEMIYMKPFLHNMNVCFYNRPNDDVIAATAI